MRKYTRLTEKERIKIENGIRSGKSNGAIAQKIDRPTKTVSQEIERNGGYLRYHAAKAHYDRNKSNREGYSKISSHENLEQYIREKLAEQWSPEVIAGRWNKEKLGPPICHETIYSWIYKQNNDLYLNLPRKKKKRGFKPQRNKSKIPNRTPIHNRPKHINDRLEAGHYEGDLLFQQGNKSQNILSIVDRRTRKMTLKKNNSKHSKVVMNTLQDIKESGYTMKSITFDNGSEFANHSELRTDTYFCDPGCPWQKGSIENVNGIIRQYIDYRTSLNDITQETLDLVVDKINNKPRKILGFLTPNEVTRDHYKEKLSGVTF